MKLLPNLSLKEGTTDAGDDSLVTIVDPDDVQRLGWVDEALNRLQVKRQIAVFTRHYQAAMLLAIFVRAKTA